VKRARLLGRESKLRRLPAARADLDVLIGEEPRQVRAKVVLRSRVVGEEDRDDLLGQAREREHVAVEVGDVRPNPPCVVVGDSHVGARSLYHRRTRGSRERAQPSLPSLRTFVISLFQTPKTVATFSLILSGFARRVRTSYPPFVTRTVCSNWAESEPSAVVT